MTRALPETYTTTRIAQVVRQALGAIVAREAIEQQVDTFASRLRRDEARIAHTLGRPVHGLDILEIGAGQQCERARYFGQRNSVTAVDLDWIPRSGGVGDYLLMLRRNGIGRLVKTAGRRMLLVDRARRRAWARAVGTDRFRDPTMMHGDVCTDPLPRDGFDLAISWSVFEHLRDPSEAMRNAWQALRPGGVFYIGIHLYTATNGHHDFRYSATGSDGLPPWAHLRASTRQLVRSSAYLNEWRLDRWRRLFSDYPGVEEHLEDYGQSDHLKGLLTAGLRDELLPYRDEELVTVDAFYVGQKPAALSSGNQ
jgi:SAM-dependent methyltransferase